MATCVITKSCSCSHFAIQQARASALISRMRKARERLHALEPDAQAKTELAIGIDCGDVGSEATQDWEAVV
jgi:hypothetical protein